MLPNLENTVTTFSQSLTFKEITQTVVNYKPVISEVTVIKWGVIFPSIKEDLQALTVDKSISYYTVLTILDININDRLSYKGKEFKQVSKEDFSDYGYYRAIYEELKC